MDKPVSKRLFYSTTLGPSGGGNIRTNFNYSNGDNIILLRGLSQWLHSFWNEFGFIPQIAAFFFHKWQTKKYAARILSSVQCPFTEMALFSVQFFSSSLRILFFQEQMDWTSICRMWVASTLIWLHDCRPDKLLSVRRSSSIILYPQFDEQTELVCASEIRDSFIQNLNEAKRSERPVRVFTGLTRFSMQKGSSSFLVSTYTLHIDGDWMRQTLTNSRCHCQI